MREAALGTALTLTRDQVRLCDEDSYVTAGILSYGKGLFVRPAVLGSETKYKSYFRIHEGQFVYSKLFAWEGALAVVTPEYDQLFVSQEFPTFDIDHDVADPDYIALLCAWPPLWDSLRTGQTGMGGRRKRVHPEHLLSVRVPLPPIADQRRIVDLMKMLDGTRRAIDSLLLASSQATEALIENLIFVASAEEGWSNRTLRELGREKSLIGGPFGSSLVRADYVEAGVPVIRGTNLSTGTRWVGGDFVFVTPDKADSLARNLALPGDVIFTQRGTLGQVAVVPPTYARFVVSQSQMRMRVAPDKALPEYIYFAFRSPRLTSAIESRKTATANPHINLRVLAELTIPVPGVDRQRAIVDCLIAIEEQVETVAANAIALDRARSAILSDLLSGDHEIPGSYDGLLESA